jgi:hypothetical protein
MKGGPVGHLPLFQGLVQLVTLSLQPEVSIGAFRACYRAIWGESEIGLNFLVVRS